MCEIKIGDRVRITQRYGQYYFWIPEMDEAIGKVGTVIRVDSVEDVLVEFKNGSAFYYPLSVIELVKEIDDV